MLAAQHGIIRRQAAEIEQAARRITESLRAGGVVHLFGSGHSHLPVEEAFYRSGMLAPVNPLLDPSLMFHEGTENCIVLEKWEGYATRFVVPRFDLRAGEVMIIFSASGRNNAPIEVALEAREKGLFTIGITSRRYSAAFPSRHSSGTSRTSRVPPTGSSSSIAARPSMYTASWETTTGAI